MTIVPTNKLALLTWHGRATVQCHLAADFHLHSKSAFTWTEEGHMLQQQLSFMDQHDNSGLSDTIVGAAAVRAGGSSPFSAANATAAAPLVCMTYVAAAGMSWI